MKRKALLLLLTLAVALAFSACGDSGSGSSDTASDEPAAEEQAETPAKAETYGVGDTWTVDGKFSVTINSITATDERNEFYDGEEPAEVVIIDYTYNNIGYENEIMDGLFVDFDKVMDNDGNMCQTYPANLNKYAQATPVGGTCNAEEAYALKVAGGTVTVMISLYDDDYNEYKATFELTR